ncbi:cation diffusion facilitator family transporter [Bacillus aerolatus]|uniref:Cation diffusion facilitator family transporter n=1 Tax=Bacillus aerolatus TaxID=2653354 RepID=A0A6I1FD84_9BACI|nr:cation diffusion facilitator family transporter [Bacillus aerolatus]KAB7705522.1 cation diffusion facilitator family transporter [Bacillus aerolatus]
MGHSHSHSHHHHHHHGHGHHHHSSNNKQALKLSFLLIATYMVIEVIGGILTNSLALLSDAGHMLSDAAALGLSYLALKFGEKEATLSKTFGYKRFEILAAFINGLTLLAISIYIFLEAYKRVLAPPEVMSKGMLIVSVIGLMVNIVAAYILMKGDKDENLNVRSAFLHVLGDLLGSVGAIAAALMIMFFGWNLADPIASVIVAILIIISGVRVTKDSFHILMEGVPDNLDVTQIKQALLALPGVKDVHDLHVWAITSNFPALSCHVVIEPNIDGQSVLLSAQKKLHDQFHIDHTTIQIDLADNTCEGDHCN